MPINEGNFSGFDTL